jgi:uncharacterized protein YpmS
MENLVETSEKIYAIILFRETDFNYSSNMKSFNTKEELNDYIDSELTNYGRKEFGIYEFATWEECVNFRINNRNLLS